MKRVYQTTFTRFYVWVGRVLPLTALLGLLLSLHFNLDSVTEILQMSIAVIFGTIAFTWWWWVVDAISNQNKFFSESYDRFTEMQENLRDIKIDISRVQKLHVDELELLSKQRKTRRKGK